MTAGRATSTTTPTQRSLKYLRDLGYTVAVVEHWNPFARIRQDMFGFIDLLAIRPGEVLGVQTTDATSVSKRVAKIADHPNVAAVRDAGIRLEVHGWRKAGTPARWQVRVVDVS